MPSFRLMAKTAVRQRSRHREFRFRFGSRRDGLHRISVAARQGGFRASLALRPADVRVFEQIFLNDHYNLRPLRRWSELWAAFQSRARQSRPLILDLGAHIGLASLYLAGQFPAARILAVEPDPGNFALLARNLAQPGAQPGIDAELIPLHAAVVSQDGPVQVRDVGCGPAAYRVAPTAADAPDAVAAYAVESLVQIAERAGPCLPFLAKIDIEGSERELFGQRLGWIRRFPILIVEPHDWMLPAQGVCAPLLRALAPLDRDFLVLGESLVSIAHDLECRSWMIGPPSGV